MDTSVTEKSEAMTKAEAKESVSECQFLPKYLRREKELKREGVAPWASQICLLDLVPPATQH